MLRLRFLLTLMPAPVAELHAAYACCLIICLMFRAMPAPLLLPPAYAIRIIMICLLIFTPMFYADAAILKRLSRDMRLFTIGR